jgi:hypothetical protein
MTKLFNLSIQSDIELNASLPASEKPDVIIKKSSQHLSDAFHLDIKNIAKFQIKNGHQIFYMPDDGVTADDLKLFLMGSCMGALLQQRGFIVLHGNAISFDNQTCTIYVGNQGAGKSTTAAYFYQQGASVLADDVCAISFNQAGQPVVLPGIPQLKLWQASADLLGLSTKHLKRVRQNLDKFILPVEKHRFVTQPCEIKEIIEIDQSSQTPQKISGLQKLLQLQYHSYRYYFLSQMGLEPAYLKKLMQLAQQVVYTKAPRVLCERADV